jgi:hypothetical protein
MPSDAQNSPLADTIQTTPEAGHKTSGFGPAPSPDVLSRIQREAKRFTARLKRRYAAEIATDTKGFKKCVVSLIKRGLPPFAGRPNEASITRADELLTQGLPWKLIYPQCIPCHATLLPAERRNAENNLRSSRRARRNKARQRKRAKHVRRDTTNPRAD